VPGAYDERQHKAHEKEIKKFKHVADDRGGNDAFLIGCKFALLIQHIKHARPPSGQECELAQVLRK
jgi:hypothetical protein